MIFTQFMRKAVYIAAFGLLFMALGMSSSFAQFEGVICFSKITPTDTVQYVYYVKNQQVRLDELTKRTGTSAGSLLGNLDDKKIVSVNYERKLYMDYKPGSAAAPVGKPEVKALAGTKKIVGLNCKGYEVKNQADGSVVTYYVSATPCRFIKELLTLLQRKDKISVYFLQLNEAKDGFPFLAIQKDLNGKEITRLEVTQYTTKPVDAKYFAVPAGFQKYQ